MIDSSLDWPARSHSSTANARDSTACPSSMIFSAGPKKDPHVVGGLKIRSLGAPKPETRPGYFKRAEKCKIKQRKSYV